MLLIGEFSSADSTEYITIHQKKELLEQFKAGHIFFLGNLSEKKTPSELNIYNKFDLNAPKRKDKNVFWMHLSEYIICKNDKEALIQKMRERYELYYEEPIERDQVILYLHTFAIRNETVWFYTNLKREIA